VLSDVTREKTVLLLLIEHEQCATNHNAWVFGYYLPNTKMNSLHLVKLVGFEFEKWFYATCLAIKNRYIQIHALITPKFSFDSSMKLYVKK
jgi:hypothetical protein